MAKTSNYWDKRAIKNMTDTEKMSEAYIERVKAIYDRAFKDIDIEIAKVYKNYSKETGLDVDKLKELLTKNETQKTWKTLKRQGLDKYIMNNYKSRISRLEQIQAQIYAKAKLIYPKEELNNTMCYKGVVNNSYYKTVYDVQYGTGYDFEFSKLNKNLLDTVLNENWSGSNYSQRIWGNTDILANSVSELLGGALLSGQGIEKTSKQIQDRFNTSKYYAERLIRTETNHFYNEANAMAYEDMGIDKYVFVATLDSRTSEMCQEHDNKVYDYKDREVGVNYPPLHPNCRSTTRGYLGKEAEKSLKRRARNPITGKVEEIDNISYKDWLKSNNITQQTTNTPSKPVVKARESVKNEPKVVKTSVNMTLNDLPAQLRTPKEVSNSQLFIDAINNPKADSTVAQVYKNMGKVTKYDFKVSHAKNSSLSYKENVRANSISDLKLTIPNIGTKDNLGAINTVLHENMHYIDLMHGNGSTFKSAVSKLNDVVKNTSRDIGNKDIQDLFDNFNKLASDNKQAIREQFSPMYKELNNKISNKELSYAEYKKQWSEINKKVREASKEAEYTERNYLGGGVSNLEDIYDALSRGIYRDTDKVAYGHGYKYYSKVNKPVKEIVANYGALSITRPDLIKLLKADKPQLVEALDEFMKSLL